MQERVETVTVDGGSFDLALWVPGSGSGPGLLLIQEIYGVSDYIRAVAADLAGLGYVVAAPDLFWRLKPGHRAAHDDRGLAESLELASRFDGQQGVADALAAMRHLAALTEVRGGVGLIGFCLGGSVVYLMAAQAKPDTVVSYYGSLVPGNLAVLDRITCPLQFQFGGSDAYIPRDQVRRVEEAVAGRPNVEINVEEQAGHAFHNRVAPMFYQPEPAERAWHRTVEFLQRTLPARQPVA
jgi:carboxymethylenebutenolidase